jgi:60 kDa SS-A/Ro ribonucleoprotein
MQKFTFNTDVTLQSRAIPGREHEMVPNRAGGVVFPVDDWARLARFVILGTTGGTYYASERAMSDSGTEAVVRCIKSDGPRVVKLIGEISASGRAPRNDPAIFVLALATHPKIADLQTRRDAAIALQKICRIPTHLFHFVEYCKDSGNKWSHLLRKAVSRYYTDKQIDGLVYHVIKYVQRDGWSHRDLLRLTHPKTGEEMRNKLFCYLSGNHRGNCPVAELGADKGECNCGADGYSVGHEQLNAALDLAKVTDPKAAVKLIVDHNLPREVVPSGLLNSVEVWEALLASMPPGAAIRNLAKMTKIGLLGPTSAATKKIVSMLTEKECLQRARIHPMQVLLAMRTYARGKGYRGNLVWIPVRQILDALDESFYLSAGNIEPTGKRTLLALDVSGSMTMDDIMAPPGADFWARRTENPAITPRDASAAMAMLTARSESDWTCMGFTGSMNNNQAAALKAASELSISPKQRLDDVIKTVSDLPFGHTDCALPCLWALEHGLEIDTFVIYTDNETWAGDIHPVQALDMYRQRTGIAAKMIAVAMTATEYSIADPNDGGMLDVVGFDASIPNIIGNFARE